MDDVRISQIRSAEAFSHTEAYANHVLFEPGSWLSKPVKTVMDLVPYFLHLQHFAGLDLGCGVGRNCIPVLQKMQNTPCRMDCVDILEFAIKQLRENAAKYHVETSVHGIVCPVDSYQIKDNSYDLILGISVLEHLDSVESLTQKLYQIRNGLHINGIACFVINTSIKEHHKATQIPLPVQFEINLQTDKMVTILNEVFLGYEVLKQSVIHYTYDTFRENGIVELHTDVLTYVVRRRR
ncbi:MAG: class I SAM-dependent methyltransferase [Oscillospiraceae bacterium]|nr:class I SAM-dependent methyltransferase [Oscillospiraceae bacterium]